MRGLLLSLRDFVLLPLLALCASALLLRVDAVQSIVSRFHGQPSGPAANERPVKKWLDYAAAGAVMGKSGAPATVIVFSDFQCPYCRALRGRLGELLDLYDGQLRIVYRHYPLQAHPQAFAAAAASACADDQRRFRAFHDAAFDHQELVKREEWDSLGVLAAVPNQAVFRRCVASGAGRSRVEADRQAGDRLGVAATPTILFDGRMTTGLPAAGVLSQRIADYLKAMPRDTAAIVATSR